MKNSSFNLSVKHLEGMRSRLPHFIGDVSFPESASEAIKLLNELIIRYSRNILPHAAKRIGMQKNELENRICKIGLIETPSINGYTHSDDEWSTFAIEISLGMMLFISKFAACFVSRVGFLDKMGKPLEEPQLKFDTTLNIATKLLTAFWEDSCKLLAVKSFRLYQLSDYQNVLQSYLISNAEHFIIAHEFGHVVIKLCQKNFDKNPNQIERPKPLLLLHGQSAVASMILSRSLGFDESKTSMLLSKVVGPDSSSTLGTDENVKMARKWGQEFTADFLGLQLVMSQYDDEIKKIFAYAAVEWVFILYIMLEKFYQKTTGNKLRMGTHPSSQWRLAALRHAARNNPSWALELGRSFEQFGNWILEKI